MVANFGHFQNALILLILGVFWSGFLHTTTIMWSDNPYLHFFVFLIFDPDSPFYMGYSPFKMANCIHFENALILGILGVFRSGFLNTTTLMCLYIPLSHLLGIFKF